MILSKYNNNLYKYKHTYINYIPGGLSFGQEYKDQRNGNFR
jgi:hypothetical protein